MKLTTAEIFTIIWNKVKGSILAEKIPVMYADHFPQQTSLSSLHNEFIVMTSLSNVSADTQIAVVNVNIYVLDATPTINGEEQRYPDRKRLAELTKIAYDVLKVYPTDERYFFDVSEETILSEEDIPYSFSNIKVQLKNY